MCLRILLSWKADTFISLKSISLEVLFEQGRADSHSPTSRKQQQQQGLPSRDDHASGLQPQRKSRGNCQIYSTLVGANSRKQNYH